MNSKIILIILGEPNSTFSEILLKYFTSVTFNKNRNKVIKKNILIKFIIKIMFIKLMNIRTHSFFLI